MAKASPENKHRHCKQPTEICSITSATLPHRKQIPASLSCSSSSKVFWHSSWSPLFWLNLYPKPFQSKESTYIITCPQTDILIYFVIFFPTSFAPQLLSASVPFLWPSPGCGALPAWHHRCAWCPRCSSLGCTGCCPCPRCPLMSRQVGKGQPSSRTTKSCCAPQSCSSFKWNIWTLTWVCFIFLKPKSNWAN